MATEGTTDPAFEAELAASLKRAMALARRNRGQRTEAGGRKSEVRGQRSEVRPAPRPARHDFRPVVGDEQLPPSDRQEGAR